MFIPFLAKSQTGFIKFKTEQKSIEFIQGISWQEVIKKAKQEGKAIFVDCFTTWCAPCKKMEKEVYSDEAVSQLFNSRFVCYKLQMDSSKNDNEVVKASYSDANFFRNAYRIFAFPTSLFFSSDGKLLNRKEGLLEVQDFIKVGQDALDPKKNYYNLLEDYNKGERNMDRMRLVARNALLLFKDTTTAMKVSRDYMARLQKADYLTKDNIEFMQLFTKSSKEVGFKIFYKNADSVNKIMNDKMYAQSLIRSIIFVEMVSPEVRKAQASGMELNWLIMGKAISKKYNDYYSDLVITVIKLDWSKYKRNWQEYVKSVISYVDGYVLPADKQGQWPAFTLNNFAWDIFKYSSDKNQLKRGLLWSGKAVLMDPNPNWMDTYANILYKLGDTELAIKWEEAATKLAPTDPELVLTLQKMKL
jgi:thioredoxin-related protein